MRIRDIHEVNDLAEGERAAPESGAIYTVRAIDRHRAEPGTTDYVYQRSDTLYARMTTGESFAVTGPGAHVLVPSRVPD